MRSTTKRTVAIARQLRRNMSPPEHRLWAVLRARPEGLKFRKQHPIGRIVLDFYCPSAKLAIEVDGDVHDMGDNPVRDAVRDRWLGMRGLRVMRFLASDVMKDVEPVLKSILGACGRT